MISRLSATCVCFFLLAQSPTPTQAADPKVVKALAKDIKNKDAKVRTRAAEALGKLGPDATAASKELCDAILDPNTTVSCAAFKALEKVRPDLHAPIAKILLERDSYRRAEGVAALGKLGREAKPAALLLSSFLMRMATEDVAQNQTIHEATVQATTYRALQSIGSEDPEVVAHLKALAGPDMKSIEHRRFAMVVLIYWAANNEARRKELLPFIKSGLDTPGLESAHINLAGGYGALAKDFLPALRKFKTSSDATIRDAAIKAVEVIEFEIK